MVLLKVPNILVILMILMIFMLFGDFDDLGDFDPTNSMFCSRFPPGNREHAVSLICFSKPAWYGSRWDCCQSVSLSFSFDFKWVKSGCIDAWRCKELLSDVKWNSIWCSLVFRCGTYEADTIDQVASSLSVWSLIRIGVNFGQKNGSKKSIWKRQMVQGWGSKRPVFDSLFLCIFPQYGHGTITF